jgi:3-phenylpropionate/trans-cinnamate dioxygenase ferredoxin subunit
MDTQDWIKVCIEDDIEAEDVIRFDYDDRTFAIYRTAKNVYYATDGLCTHQNIHLADGLVIGNLIECPKHNGRFDYTTGETKRPPVCIKLKTYPVNVKDGNVFIKI